MVGQDREEGKDAAATLSRVTRLGSVNVLNKRAAGMDFAVAELADWNTKISKYSRLDPPCDRARFAAHHARELGHREPVASPVIRWDRTRGGRDGGVVRGFLNLLNDGRR